MSQVLSAQEVPAALVAFARLLRAHAQATRLLSAELQREHGLTLNDYEALMVLARAEGQRMKRVELARRLLLTPSGVTRLLEGLERAGLVERAACDSDLRVTYAQLTQRGAENVRAVSCGHESSVRSLFEERYSDEELAKLADLLAKMPGVTDADDACGVD